MINIKKQLKFFIQKYFLPKINDDIFDKKIIKNQESNNKDIIVFSNISWNYRFQRPQQFVTHLAKQGYRIFYIENEFNISSKNNFPIQINTISKNIFKTKLSSTNNYFIYQQKSSSLDQLHILNSLNHLIKITNIKNPTILVNHPFWTNIALSTGYKVIYDCMDYHAGFKYHSTTLNDLEQKLIKQSNQVIVSSNFLHNYVSQYRKNNISIINNASDYDYFKATNIYPQNITPIIGYYGALENWFDTNLIDKIAKSNKCQLVFAGQNNNKILQKLSTKYSNIKLMGEIPYSQIPKLLSSFDICIIPFVINKLIQATDPVKIYEYFASGKPVISTNIPELARYPHLVYIANSQNILDKITDALNEKSSLKSQRITFAKSNTWTHRTNQLINLIKSNS